jgi:DNA-binding HxlR family transcriptional regulator
MAKRGLGNTQIGDYKTAKDKILKVVNDGDWHRYSELTEKTKLSTATLSKHLKELERGIVERCIDVESGDYPPPVFYRIKPAYIEITSAAKIFLKVRCKKTIKKSPALFLHNLNTQFTFEVIGLLKEYFHDPNENIAFNQALEHYVLDTLKENYLALKDTLKEQLENGENVTAIMDNAEKALVNLYIKDLKVLSKPKRKWI